MVRLHLVDLNYVPDEMGQYAARKRFDVIEDENFSIKNVNGWVVQLIEKNSSARCLDGQVLRTSEDFSRFTKNKVNDMTFSYIERFPIKKGQSIDEDEFASGFVAKVEKGKSQVVVPEFEQADTPYMTEGRIVHRGTSLLFITPEKIEALNKLPWTKLRPANGLDSLDIRYWDGINDMGSDSTNMPIHEVIATWWFRNNKTVVHNKFYDNPMLGGNRRKARKTRKNIKN